MMSEELFRFKTRDGGSDDVDVDLFTTNILKDHK